MTTTATSSDLVFDPYDHDTIRNPHATFRRMRDEAPLYYNADIGFYAVSRFEDVERVLLTPDVFISSRGVTLDMLRSNGHIPPGTVIFDDEPVHGIHRRLLSRMFTPRRLADLEPGIRKLCGDLLDPFVGSDGFDFVRDLGSMVPMQVIGMLLGIPTSDQVEVREHFVRNRARRESGEVSVEAYGLDGAIFADYIDYRIDHPSDDIMSHLLHTEFTDEHGVARRLRRDELLAYINIVAAAGNGTTMILIGFMGRLLAEHPDERRLLVDDPSLIPRAVEETLRYEPNTLTNCRYAATDIEFYGQVVPAGSIMATLTPSAGRDPRQFDDPDRFDVRRDPSRHLYFGFGTHYCIGQALARLEGRVVLEEVLRRFPEWDADVEHSTYTYIPDNRGFSSLPIVLG